jgi:hypothetical protein
MAALPSVEGLGALIGAAHLVPLVTRRVGGDRGRRHGTGVVALRAFFIFRRGLPATCSKAVAGDRWRARSSSA